MDSDDQDYKYKKKLDELAKFKVGLTTFESIIDRNATVGDPMIRSMLFLDKMLLMTDISNAFLEIFFADFKKDLKPEDYCTIEEQKNKVVEKFKREIACLTEWVSSPTYDPDHPYGKSVMRCAQRDFEQNNEKSFKNSKSNSKQK